MTSTWCNVFKTDLLGMEVHRSTYEYRIALYSEMVTLTADITEYSTRGELPTGSGYRQGGLVLEGFTVKQADGVAILSWKNPRWEMAAFSAAGALIYNATRQDRAVAVLDFEKTVGSVNAAFAIRFPDPEGILRLA